MEYLIERGVNIDSLGEMPTVGVTPLATAAFYGSIKCVELLFDAGADINGNATAIATPLALAVSTQQKEVIQFLLSKGADLGYGKDRLSSLKISDEIKDLLITHYKFDMAN